jgi:trehalose 6-phosphate synthase
LRRLSVDNALGFFLHIPFPAPNVLTTLPVHEALVRQPFAYNLLGFQTETDVQAFGDYVEQEAGGWIGDDGIMHAFGTSVRGGSFPISIDTRVVTVRPRDANSASRTAA